MRGIGEDGDDDPVEDGRRAGDDVEVAVRDRVERTGVDRDAWLAHRSSSTAADPSAPDGADRRVARRKKVSVVSPKRRSRSDR